MKRGHCIGVDVHSQFCEVAVLDGEGELLWRERCDTSIVALRTVLEKAPRPRRLVIEEGPLAGWLWRNLEPVVEEMVVAEPRRNRLIAKDGDKDDDLDAEKLARLFWGGYVKAVHQTDSLERAIFKQLVKAYHEAVRRRVADGHKIWSLLRRHGVMVRSRDFEREEERAALLARLPANETLVELVKCLWEGYDAANRQEEQLRKSLVTSAKAQEVVRRFVEVPGVGWIWAATIYAYLDAPGRFRSKAALWKYLGIGLERRHSGAGSEKLRLPWQVNRLLKGAILGAAKSAAAAKDNPFADLYRRWLEQGLSRQLARRNVARALAATLWGLWKNGSAYRPDWVGRTTAAITTAAASRR